MNLNPVQKASELPAFRAKAAAMAEVALEDAYLKAVDGDTPLKMKLEFVELCSKLADLQPKQSQQVQAGPGFMINIVYDSPAGVKPVNIIEYAQESVENSLKPVQLDALESLTIPEYCDPELSEMLNLDLKYVENEMETV